MSKEFTPTEKFLFACILNNEAPPTYDWEQIMADTGMKSLGGTRNKLGLLTKAFKEAKAKEDATNDDTTTTTATTAVPKTPRKRKAAADDDDPSTPKSVKTPRTRKAKGKKEAIKEETAEENAAEEDGAGIKTDVEAEQD